MSKFAIVLQNAMGKVFPSLVLYNVLVIDYLNIYSI